MKNNVDLMVLAEILEKSRFKDKMREAIWLFFTQNKTKAELGRQYGVTRQHVSRSVNDFLRKNAKKLFTQ